MLRWMTKLDDQASMDTSEDTLFDIFRRQTLPRRSVKKKVSTIFMVINVECDIDILVNVFYNKKC